MAGPLLAEHPSSELQKYKTSLYIMVRVYSELVSKVRWSLACSYRLIKKGVGWCPGRVWVKGFFFWYPCHTHRWFWALSGVSCGCNSVVRLQAWKRGGGILNLNTVGLQIFQWNCRRWSVNILWVNERKDIRWVSLGVDWKKWIPPISVEGHLYWNGE